MSLYRYTHVLEAHWSGHRCLPCPAAPATAHGRIHIDRPETVLDMGTFHLRTAYVAFQEDNWKPEYNHLLPAPVWGCTLAGTANDLSRRSRCTGSERLAPEAVVNPGPEAYANKLARELEDQSGVMAGVAVMGN